MSISMTCLFLQARPRKARAVTRRNVVTTWCVLETFAHARRDLSPDPVVTAVGIEPSYSLFFYFKFI
jgi:hypothetical protein